LREAQNQARGAQRLAALERLQQLGLGEARGQLVGLDRGGGGFYDCAKAYGQM
jgi:hypothetical protein